MRAPSMHAPANGATLADTRKRTPERPVIKKRCPRTFREKKTSSIIWNSMIFVGSVSAARRAVPIVAKQRGPGSRRTLQRKPAESRKVLPNDLPLLGLAHYQW